MKADQNDIEDLAVLLTTAGCNYFKMCIRDSRCTPDNPRAAAAAELETLLREVV